MITARRCGRGRPVGNVAGWFKKDKTLGIALDLDAGVMSVSVDGGEWAVVVPDGCNPSVTAGATLFPAVSGGKGARMRFNWGVDAVRQLKYAPPSAEYQAVGLASKVLCPRCPCPSILLQCSRPPLLLLFSFAPHPHPPSFPRLRRKWVGHRLGTRSAAR